MDPRVHGPQPTTSFEELVRSARNRSQEALGRLLDACRPYLLLVANQQLRPELRAKVCPSDIVQETFLRAADKFVQFQGSTEPELLAWLRRILLNHLANVGVELLQTQKRQIGREVAEGDLPPGRAIDDLSDPGDSPSEVVIAREETEELERALARLPDHYRQVIRWRNNERVSWEEIGQRLGTSGEAARKIWTRALELLAEALEPPDASR
jgi:RNA polymerase sigma-70 factor (ECF subfamily)